MLGRPCCVSVPRETQRFVCVSVPAVCVALVQRVGESLKSCLKSWALYLPEAGWDEQAADGLARGRLD